MFRYKYNFILLALCAFTFISCGGGHKGGGGGGGGAPSTSSDADDDSGDEERYQACVKRVEEEIIELSKAGAIEHNSILFINTKTGDRYSFDSNDYSAAADLVNHFVSFNVKLNGTSLLDYANIVVRLPELDDNSDFIKKQCMSEVLLTTNDIEAPKISQLPEDSKLGYAMLLGLFETEIGTGEFKWFTNGDGIGIIILKSGDYTIVIYFTELTE